MKVTPRPTMLAAVGIGTRIGANDTVASELATSVMAFSLLHGLMEWNDLGWQRLGSIAIIGPGLHHQPARLNAGRIALVDVPNASPDEVPQRHFAVPFFISMVNRPIAECGSEAMNGDVLSPRVLPAA